MLKTIAHDQIIRHANWLRPFCARAFNVQGYARSHGYDVEVTVSRAKANGHDLFGSVFTGMTITTSKESYRRENVTYEAATILEDGEHVMFEGVELIVCFAQGNSGQFPRNSDPINFKPAVQS